MCLQAQYLFEKQQLVNRNGHIAKKRILSDADPLSKGIEADRSCGRDEPGGGHLKKKKEKQRREQRVKGGSDDQPV